MTSIDVVRIPARKKVCITVRNTRNMNYTNFVKNSDKITKFAHIRVEERAPTPSSVEYSHGHLVITTDCQTQTRPTRSP